MGLSPDDHSPRAQFRHRMQQLRKQIATKQEELEQLQSTLQSLKDAGEVYYGTWWIKSQCDPRWNDSGRATVGNFRMPVQARRSLYFNRKRFGNRPDDLDWGYEPVRQEDE